MKSNTPNRFWYTLAILMLAALSCSLPQSGSVPAPFATQAASETQSDPNDGLSQVERTRLIAATVQIDVLYKKDGKLKSVGTGSGTILNKSGMILTNAHVAAPATRGEGNNPDALSIGIIQAEDKPPVFSYLAELKAADGYLDLAVVQIVSTMDGTSIDPNSLNLPYVELGNSDEVRIGDHINIFGFPGIGGSTITYTDGNVSGFVSDDTGDRAWIKTDGTIAGGNSGGLATNDQALIIGVPTRGGAGYENTAVTDCRVLQDTNGDNVIDEKDSCVPFGGFINSIRSIQLALPLIQAAQNGAEYTSPYRVPGVAYEDGTGNEELSGFAWLDTSNATQSGCETTGSFTDAYPAEALCIAVSFGYSGMIDGEQFAEVVYINGEKVAEFMSVWGNGEKSQNPVWFPLFNGGDPMPSGAYYVEFYAGKELRKVGTTPKINVGASSFTLYGLITDAKTGKPIPDAYAMIINGTYEQWQSKDFPKESTVAIVQTDKSGNYRIEDIPLNIPYTYVFAAKGYNDYYENDVTFETNTPKLVEVNIELRK